MNRDSRLRNPGAELGILCGDSVLTGPGCGAGAKKEPGTLPQRDQRMDMVTTAMAALFVDLAQGGSPDGTTAATAAGPIILEETVVDTPEESINDTMQVAILGFLDYKELVGARHRENAGLGPMAACVVVQAVSPSNMGATYQGVNDVVQEHDDLDFTILKVVTASSHTKATEIVDATLPGEVHHRQHGMLNMEYYLALMARNVVGRTMMA